MRSLILVGSLAAAMAVPAFANAQTACERDRSTNRVAGTVVGAGLGALLGSAIAGNSSNTAGVVVGGVAGGIAGNQIAKNRGQPCPQGYYETPTTAPLPPPVAGPPPGGFWANGPTDVRDRIGFLEDRIRNGERDGSLSGREADQAYRDLNDVRRMERELRRRDGGRLNYADRDYIQARLNDVGQRVRWARRNDAYASGWYDSQGRWHAR